MPGISAGRVFEADEDGRTKMASPLPPSSDLPDPEAVRSQNWRHQTSNPAILVPGDGGAMCKYCNARGNVYEISNPGPVHDGQCSRWAERAPPKRRESSPLNIGPSREDRLISAAKFSEKGGSMKNLVSTGSIQTASREGSSLSDEDQKKKAMLHKQMLDLKKQLEEQLQRLQHTALVDKGPAAAGGGGGGSASSTERSSKEHESGRGSRYDRL